MNSIIFIPKKIKVGYAKREDTYSKKLAFIIYYDEKGKLRQEKTWNDWIRYNERSYDYHTREHTINKINPDDFDNEPLSGFVLNKKVGDHNSGWNGRKAYCRVYDPRGFEIEIGIDNLLYILENCNSLKGKGLEGEFVYGWSGTKVFLMPTSSPDYISMQEYNQKVFENNTLKKKDMIKGHIYINKHNEKLTYLDHALAYNMYGENKPVSKTKRYFFYKHNDKNEFDRYKIHMSTTLNFLIKDTNQLDDDYANLMDKLECSPEYSPYDDDNIQWNELKEKDIIEESLNSYNYRYNENIGVKINNIYYKVKLGVSHEKGTLFTLINYRNYHFDEISEHVGYYKTKQDLINNVTFYIENKYLKNGKKTIY